MSLILGLLSLGVTTAEAQQADSDDGGAPALKQRAFAPGQGAKRLSYYLRNPEVPIPSAVKERVPDRMLKQIEKRRESGAETSGRRTPAPTVFRGFPEFTEDQSWALAENPAPSLNFDLTGTPTPAGDVNGDGTNDYLYTDGFVRDDRSAVLEDETAKTALYFGGDPQKEPDQVLYTFQGGELRPVGDLNGDGHDDAVAARGNEVIIYTGGPDGYTRAEEEVFVDLGRGIEGVRGFTDLDGDGNEDVVVFSRFSQGGRFAVIYGADDVRGIEVREYSAFRGDFPRPEAFELNYNAADLEDDGQGEVVRLAGRRPNIKVQTLEVDSTRSVTQTQSFVAGELDSFFGADRANLSLIDITGNDTLEIAAKRSFGGTTYVFERDTDTTYAETPVSFTKDDAVPVGDLDKDGRQDFFTFEESTDTRYVSYGPENLEDGLSFEGDRATEIPYEEGVFGTVDFSPQGGLGDVTGNGQPDMGLSLSDNPDETVGRRFFSVNSDRNQQAIADVSYPEGRFFDRILSAQEIGDFNGDGTKDFALVRFDLGQIEVFYGGSSISQTPDLTLENPIGENYVSITKGDFNGDGTTDIAAEYNLGSRIDIFLGGEGTDGQVDHTINADDLEISSLDYVHAIGDVNDNGADDLLVSDVGSPDSLAVFFGGETLPSTAGATIEYDGSFSAGETLAAPGDVNGDGVDDFVVGLPRFRGSENNGTGRADVYFGSEDPSFSEPDQTLRPDSSSEFVSFSNGLAGGDFDGDGSGDIAVRPLDAQGGVSISVYEGSESGFDGDADERLSVPAETGLGSGFGEENASFVRGALEAISLPGPSDGLVQGSAFSGTNAVLYRPLAGSPEPAAVFRAPNRDADLGGFSNVFGGFAAGDFTENGRTDVVFPQTRDNNDAALSSRVYRYKVEGIPVVAATEFVDANGTAFDSTAGLGLSIDFADISGEGTVNTERYADPPVNASGLNTDVAARYTVKKDDGLAIGAGTTVQFDVGELPVQDTSSVVIYQRSTPDEGVFSGLETTYDPDSGTLTASTESFGEFALAPSPDSVTVWAGDTNNDGTVDQADVLPLGTYWDQSGPARDDEANCDWTGDSAAPWTPEAATYADANGDGTVDQEDVLCLGINWGETRSTSSSAALAAKGSGDEPAGELALRRAEESGPAIWVELHAREVESLVGVATELTFDPEVVSVEAVEPGDRMGESALLQSNTNEETGTLGLGVSRKGTAASKAAGDGAVARIKLRSEVPKPEIGLQDGQATTTEGQPVSLATDGGLDALPEEVTLEPPAPNPVRQQATLRYALPEAQQVRLAVYDVLGREVAVLVDEKQQAGEKQVSVDASRWSSGTYFYRLDAKEATMTKRLTIVR